MQYIVGCYLKKSLLVFYFIFHSIHINLKDFDMDGSLDK